MTTIPDPVNPTQPSPLTTLADALRLHSLAVLNERDHDAAVHRAWNEGIIGIDDLEAAWDTGRDPFAIAGITLERTAAAVAYASALVNYHQAAGLEVT